MTVTTKRDVTVIMGPQKEWNQAESGLTTTLKDKCGRSSQAASDNSSKTSGDPCDI